MKQLTEKQRSEAARQLGRRGGLSTAKKPGHMSKIGTVGSRKRWSKIKSNENK